MQASGKRSPVTGRLVELTLVAVTSADELLLTSMFDLLSVKTAGSISVDIGSKNTRWVTEEGAE